MHLGIAGSIFATICVFTPSFLILMGIIPFFDRLRAYPQFNKVINGILCSFVGLLAVITYHFTIDIHWNVITVIVTFLIFAFTVRKAI
jgi:chromate transporter